MNKNLKNIIHDVDLCVVGAGLSGMCAAIAAARHGLKVALMHDRAVFGGNASSEIRMWICGALGANNRETGIIEEIALENLYRNPYRTWPVWDSVLYEIVKKEKNITAIMNCSCNDAEMEGNKIINISGWQTTTQRWHTVRAKYYADCSGDSILAPLTGAEFRIGREAKHEFGEDIALEEADKKTMGMSCLLQARETNEKRGFIPPGFARKFTPETLTRTPSIDLVNNFWWVELGGEQDSICDTEEIRDELLEITYGLWDYLKNNSDDKRAENWELDFVGFLPGKRESRRYVGDYILSQNDVRAEGKFKDLIAYGGWSMDDHNPKGFYGKTANIFHPAPSPYGIPYRCIYSKNIDNLFFAGRNISVTHLAMSSTRVMATCALLGQAVGTAAAIASINCTSPRGVYENYIDELKQILMEDDCYLPFNKRRVSEIIKKAYITSTGRNAELLRNGYDRKIDDEDNCWTGKVGDTITFSFDCVQKINEIRFVFDSDLDRKTICPEGKEENEYINQHSTICHVPINNPIVNVPKTLVKNLKIEIQDKEETWKEIKGIEDNYQRFVKLKVCEDASAVKITLTETNGNEECSIYSIDFN